MRRLRQLKILATLGPSSNDYDTIRALFEAGADAFRLNMSHSDHAEIAARHAIIRRIEVDLGRPIGIVADLQGPKLRVGVFASESVDIEDGDRFRLDLDETPGDRTRVCLPHREIFDALKPGAALLVDDGKIRLKVDDCGHDFAECMVVVGGTISNRKGVNVPDVVLPVAALSDKDRDDLEFVCELGIDWLALSFVQRPDDVTEARDLTRGRASILSKIEKPAAVNAFADILRVSDGIMVARGDLGVELPVHAVPPIQKRLVRACRAAAKPVIVATQMLESMIESPVPTRAEVSDVAAAIYEGTDAVMLSAESAAGHYPVEAVQTMNNVAIEVERDPNYLDIIDAARGGRKETTAEGIVAAAREIAETTDIRAICCFSESGTTALLTARERPHLPIVALTSRIGTARKLSLSWGMHCIHVTHQVDRFKSAVIAAIRVCIADKIAVPSDQIVVTAGIPFNHPGSTNILRVAPCQERLIFASEPE